MIAADCEAVAALEREAREALQEQRGGPVHLAERPAVGDWTQVLDSTHRFAWVGTIDDVPVGYIEVLHRDGVAEVLQVFVHPEARELGFGDWLLEAALDHARTGGCTAVEGTALPGDRDTKNLYERAAITARKITLWKAL